MAHVTIYGKNLTKPETEALKALVVDAACAEGDIVVADAVDPSAQAYSDPVVLLLGTAAMCADPDLEPNLVCAHKTAQRVIWIWPVNSEAAELPAAVAKYGYSYVPWDAKKLAGVTADDDVVCFETATGERVPTVPTERNLCVDDEESEVKTKVRIK